jgi:hypothetical protein
MLHCASWIISWEQCPSHAVHHEKWFETYAFSAEASAIQSSLHTPRAVGISAAITTSTQFVDDIFDELTRFTKSAIHRELIYELKCKEWNDTQRYLHNGKHHESKQCPRKPAIIPSRS